MLIENTKALPTGGAPDAITLDCTVARDFTYTFPAGNCTVTVQGLPCGNVAAFTCTQDGVGGRTITWAGQIPTAPVAGDLQPAVGAAAVTTFLLFGTSLTNASARIVARLV